MRYKDSPSFRHLTFLRLLHMSRVLSATFTSTQRDQAASEFEAHASLCSTVIAPPFVVVVLPSVGFGSTIPNEVQIKFKFEKKI